MPANKTTIHVNAYLFRDLYVTIPSAAIAGERFSNLTALSWQHLGSSKVKKFWSLSSEGGWQSTLFLATFPLYDLWCLILKHIIEI